MSLSIFDIFFTLLDWLWEFFSWTADLGIRFVSAVFDFGLKGVSAGFSFLIKALNALCGMMLSPFTRGLDWLWDWSLLDLRALFVLIMWVLLAACLLVALFAVGSNVYRKYQHHIK